MKHGGSAICLSKSHVQTEGSQSIYRSTSHPNLELSPLSRPHPHTQLHPCASYGGRPHPALREKLFAPESMRPSSSKPLPPSLEFTPGGSEYNPPVSEGFQLGVATESSPGSGITSSPRKDSYLNKTAKQGKRGTILSVWSNTNKINIFLVPQAPVVVTDDEVAVSCSIQGDMAVPPTGGIDQRTSEPEVKVLDGKSTPPTMAAGSHGSTKARSPILLYRWCFKVLPKGMVILLGFKRYIWHMIVKWMDLLVTYIQYLSIETNDK